MQSFIAALLLVATASAGSAGPINATLDGAIKAKMSANTEYSLTDGGKLDGKVTVAFDFTDNTKFAQQGAQAFICVEVLSGWWCQGYEQVIDPIKKTINAFATEVEPERFETFQADEDFSRLLCRFTFQCSPVGVYTYTIASKEEDIIDSLDGFTKIDKELTSVRDNGFTGGSKFTGRETIDQKYVDSIKQGGSFKTKAGISYFNASTKKWTSKIEDSSLSVSATTESDSATSIMVSTLGAAAAIAALAF